MLQRGERAAQGGSEASGVPNLKNKKKRKFVYLKKFLRKRKKKKTKKKNEECGGISWRETPWQEAIFGLRIFAL